MIRYILLASFLTFSACAQSPAVAPPAPIPAVTEAEPARHPVTRHVKVYRLTPHQKAELHRLEQKEKWLTRYLEGLKQQNDTEDADSVGPP